MKREELRPYFPSIMLLVMMAMASAYFWRLLPEMLPTKFDLQGNPTQYSPRNLVVLLMPVVFFVLVTTLPRAIGLSSKKLQIPQAATLIGRILTAVGLLFSSIHLGILTNAAEPGRFPPALFISFGLGLFMIALGLTLEKIERNLLIGFRTPWAMATEANWAATHRFGAKVMVVTGFLVLVMTTLAVPSLVASISSLVFAAVIPIFYSLWYFQNVEKPGLQK